MTDYKAVNPDENFDWEAFENGGVKPEMNKEDLTKKQVRKKRTVKLNSFENNSN